MTLLALPLMLTKALHLFSLLTTTILIDQRKHTNLSIPHHLHLRIEQIYRTLIIVSFELDTELVTNDAMTHDPLQVDHDSSVHGDGVVMVRDLCDKTGELTT